MCGIFGIVRHQGDEIPDKSRLEETAKLLRHRGPDDYGIYADSGIGLVHTRLSLLDLGTRSNQPFWDKQGRYGLVYNGEIYNFKELRTELEKRGVQFRTTSDTEVLLQCLITNGVKETLPKLEGMFAFAIYDKVEKTLVVGRDRFGIKPLFVYEGDDVFVFASEIQAMRPWIKLEPDPLTISSFLLGFGGPPTKGHSFFEKIKYFSPGTIVKIRISNSSQYSTFFAMPDFWDPNHGDQLRRLKPIQIVDKVEELLLDSVKQQLVADSPVGALCSGGVDSSLITAMATKYHNNLAIFHANVVGPRSEYEAALRLAKHLKLDLKAVEAHDQDFIDLFPDVLEHYGHPFCFIPSSLPFLMVSQLVRCNSVKAVLTGEGADECFFGYNFLVPNVRRWREYTFDIIKVLIKTVLARRRESNATPTVWDTYRSREIPLSSERLVMGLHDRFEVALETEDIRTRVQCNNRWGTIKRNTKSLDLFNYNLRSLLHRNDAMGMAESIESRFPFLDSHLVKLAVNLPYKYKIRFSPTAFDKNHYFFRDKWVLRKVAERYLPKELVQREKGLFRTDLYQHMKISPAFFENSFIADFFDLSTRERRYLLNNARHDLKLKLLQLDAWAHVCLNNLPKQLMVNKLRDHITLPTG